MSTLERVFISYRRDDAAGYAGRLEEALEARFGRGSVFRDVLDIAPGADFVTAIHQRLARAQAVLVLIGPRWAGAEGDGTRRIDDAQDFVRMEVQAALHSNARVIPVLLPGATMPSEDELPAPLRPLARRNALNLHDVHFDADIERLIAAIAPPQKRRLWPWALGGAAIVAAAAAGYGALRPAAVGPAERLVGSWRAEVRYDWGDRYSERFEFKRHAGELTGTADFLRHPRQIEKLQFDGTNVRFETRSEQTMGGETREVVRVYAAELHGSPPDERLAFRMHMVGAFGSPRPIEFEARREPAADSAAGSR